MTISRQKVLTIVGVIAILILIALALSYFGAGNRGPSGIAANNMPPAPVMPRSPDGLLHSLSGIIVEIGSGEITVRALLPGKKDPQNVTITVDASTAISLQKQKDPAVLQKEMQEFQSSRPAESGGAPPAAPPPPPLPFTNEPVAFAALKAGMIVDITPAEGTKENATSIRAAKITSMQPPAPVVQ